jgi:hypothetical protein
MSLVDELVAKNRQLEQKLDRLLNHCQDGECSECAKIICPFEDPMHFHHDGCPSCYVPEATNVPA